MYPNTFNTDFQFEGGERNIMGMVGTGIHKNLLAHEYTLPWLKMMREEMERIADNKSDINPYAITNEAEFFAVISEYFFEQKISTQRCTNV